MKKSIIDILHESANIKRELASNGIAEIELTAQRLIESISRGKKLVMCGNGGSAADCQHIVTELVHQFEIHRRKSLSAVTLTTNTSLLTAVGNDWSFDEIFSRQVEAHVNPGDIFIGLSTSGNSLNVVNALIEAKKRGAFTAAMTGLEGGKASGIADITIRVPSKNTARIQESHITIGHILCKLVEEALNQDEI